MQKLRLSSSMKKGQMSFTVWCFLFPAGPEDFLVLWGLACGEWSCLPWLLLDGVEGGIHELVLRYSGIGESRHATMPQYKNIQIETILYVRPVLYLLYHLLCHLFDIQVLSLPGSIISYMTNTRGSGLSVLNIVDCLHDNQYQGCTQTKSFICTECNSLPKTLMVWPSSPCLSIENCLTRGTQPQNSTH